MTPTTICFLFFCWLAPGVVPDGAGGVMPIENSRIMPDGSLRPYDPAIDGMQGGFVPDGLYPSVAPMPEPPAAYYNFSAATGEVGAPAARLAAEGMAVARSKPVTRDASRYPRMVGTGMNDPGQGGGRF